MNDDIDPFNPPGFILGGHVKFDLTFSIIHYFLEADALTGIEDEC
jgi:hypothetical protein